MNSKISWWKKSATPKVYNSLQSSMNSKKNLGFWKRKIQGLALWSRKLWQIEDHGPHNYKKLCGRCLSEFRRLGIQSVMLVFSTPLVNQRPSNLLAGWPPPLPCVSHGGMYFQTEKHLPPNPFSGQFLSYLVHGLDPVFCFLMNSVSEGPREKTYVSKKKLL